MTLIDSLIGMVIVGTFLFFIGSKIYDHEKEHLDPLIKKIKGWFIKEESDLTFEAGDEYELGFYGQIR